VLGRRLQQSSTPQRLLAAAVAAYTLAFAADAMFDKPGRGIGQLFYLAIILVALATGPLWGAAAGVLAALLFWSGLFVGGHGVWSHVASIGGGIRLGSFVVAGATVGYFAQRARRMMGDSLHVLDQLLVLANRDLTTGISSAHAFETAVTQRLSERRPFALLVGVRPSGPVASGPREDGALRRIAFRLSAELERDRELTRVGDAHFALVLGCAGSGEARAASTRLERAFEDDSRMSFGWAMYPQDGDDLLSLFRAADERLYARMAVRGEWLPTAVSAGLVEDLDRLRKVSSA
jgi:hypothetical protein